MVIIFMYEELRQILGTCVILSGTNIPSVGGTQCLVLEHSLYDVCFCANFGGDGCAGTATLGTDALSETTPRAVAGWGERTGDCGVNSDINVG